MPWFALAPPVHLWPVLILALAVPFKRPSISLTAKVTASSVEAIIPALAMSAALLFADAEAVVALSTVSTAIVTSCVSCDAATFLSLKAFTTRDSTPPTAKSRDFCGVLTNACPTTWPIRSPASTPGGTLASMANLTTSSSSAITNCLGVTVPPCTSTAATPHTFSAGMYNAAASPDVAVFANAIAVFIAARVEAALVLEAAAAAIIAVTAFVTSIGAPASVAIFPTTAAEAENI